MLLQENNQLHHDLGVKVRQNFTHYPLHHVTYAPVKFEVVSFNCLKDAFTRKYTDGLKKRYTRITALINISKKDAKQ